MSGKEGAQTWEHAVKKATRAVVVVVHNLTPFVMLNARTDLDHGVWRLFPPERIEPYAEAKFAMTSAGVLGGVVARMEWRLADAAPPAAVALAWANPWLGARSAECRLRTQQGHAHDWVVRKEHSDMNLMEVKYEIRPSEFTATPAPAPSAEPHATLQEWKQLQLQAARSVTVAVTNTLSVPLERRGSNIPHGQWSKFPAQLIPANSRTEFGIRSALGGAVGQVTYAVPGAGADSVTLDFANPLVGALRCDGAALGRLRVRAAAAPAAHAVAQYTVSADAALAPADPHAQLAMSMANQQMRVFGAPLRALLAKEGRLEPAQAPLLVALLVDELQRRGLGDRFLFLRPGTFADHIALRHEIESKPVGNILKCFLAELEDPVIPQNMSNFFISFMMGTQFLPVWLSAEDMAASLAFTDFYRAFLASLPAANVALLRAVCALLHAAHRCGALPAARAGSVFAPLLCPSVPLPGREEGALPYLCQSVEVLIEHFPLLFAPEGGAPDAAADAAPPDADNSVPLPPTPAPSESS